MIKDGATNQTIHVYTGVYIEYGGELEANYPLPQTLLAPFPLDMMIRHFSLCNDNKMGLCALIKYFLMIYLARSNIKVFTLVYRTSNPS